MQLAAISYDPVKVLFEFGKQHKIRYPLLSDPKSKTIEAYEIRNQEAKGSRIDGVPYPGTYLIDQKGIIRAKIFLEGYQKRHQPGEIIKVLSNLPKDE